MGNPVFCLKCFTLVDLEDPRHPPWLPIKCWTCTLEATAIDQTTSQNPLVMSFPRPAGEEPKGHDLLGAPLDDSD